MTAAVALLVLVVTTAASGWAHAHEPGQSHRQGSDTIALTVPDVTVVDQEGRPRRFHSDLVRDRVVAINFMYTTCTTACPLLGIAFAGLQTRMGERIGRDVHLISITVDPGTDTPARMRAWGARHGAGPGWTLVTGARPEIFRLLRALGVTAAQKDDHPTFVLIGNDRRAEWSRAWGLLPADALVPLIEGRLAWANPSAGR